MHRNGRTWGLGHTLSVAEVADGMCVLWLHASFSGPSIVNKIDHDLNQERIDFSQLKIASGSLLYLSSVAKHEA